MRPPNWPVLRKVGLTHQQIDDPCARLAVQKKSLKDFVCQEKTPCTLNASVQTCPAILIQKDDAKAQGIRANRRQKNRLRGKASVSFERGCLVILLNGVLSR